MTKPARVDRFRRLERSEFDVIVVGAGIGGLTAAALLAKRGKSVLVVDQHYVAGGNATIFKRPGFEFDIGIHYLGQCGPDGALTRILSAAGADDVEFLPLDPDGFDTLVYPDFELAVPSGMDRYRERLLERFPNERRAIDDNLRLIGDIGALMETPASLSGALRLAPRLVSALRYQGTTLARFLASRTRDPRLVATLAAECGDYALPPSRAAAWMHAGLMAHYLSQGAFYPSGGGQVMSDRLADSIERSGGKILLSTRATRILVEAGAVRGVEIRNKHLGCVTLRASTVIANSDIKQTLLDLVEPGAIKKRTRRRVERWEMAPALGVAYLGVRPEALGGRTRNTNYWIYADYELEQQYRTVASGGFPERPFVFISLASLKDPQNTRIAPPGVVNLQVMGLAPSEAEAWGVTDAEVASGTYGDSPSYQERKAMYQAALLRAAERVFPDLSRHVVFSEVATPLTQSRYTLSTGGTSYGLAATPTQFGLRRPGPKTEVRGLLLCGASAVAGHGIAGAMTGGVLACAAVLGANVAREVLAAPQATLPALRARAGRTTAPAV